MMETFLIQGQYETSTGTEKINLHKKFQVLIQKKYTFCQEEEVARTKLDVGRTGRELEEAKKKIVVAEREKEELQEDRAIHKAEAVELKRQIG